MKMKWLSILATCLLTQTALADTPSRPLACPTVSAINVELDKLQVVNHGNGWEGNILDVALNTIHQWFVYTTPISADNEKEAVRMIKRSIPTFMLIEGPVLKGESWGCMYFNSDQNIMIATTQPMDDMVVNARF